MMSSRCLEHRIVRILKEIEEVRLLNEVYWEYGISDDTYYNREPKYGGMEVVSEYYFSETTES